MYAIPVHSDLHPVFVEHRSAQTFVLHDMHTTSKVAKLKEQGDIFKNFSQLEDQRMEPSSVHETEQQGLHSFFGKGTPVSESINTVILKLTGT
jgi:hypothetical protein